MRILVIFIFSCFLSLQASAQNDTKWLLGNVDVLQQKSINLKDIIANPKFTCPKGDGFIRRFEISLYINETMEIEGPVIISSEDLTPEAIALLKRNMHNSGKLFIDPIKVIGNDKRMRVYSPFILNSPNSPSLRLRPLALTLRT